MISWFHRTWARLRAVRARPALDAEFDAEIAHHLELATQANLARGLSPEEARRQALLAFGGVQQTRELHRAARGLPWWDALRQDLEYAFRGFRRSPGFAATAFFVLVVGIGLNTTVFSLVDTAILRPLPFAHAGHLMWITNGRPGTPPTELSQISSTVHTWEELRRANASLAQLEAYNPFSARQTHRLNGGDRPETALAVQVSPGLFEMLGIHPALGRGFLPEDAVKNAPPRTVVSHGLWQRRFGSDPNVIGRTIDMNGAKLEIIGVMPANDPFAAVFFPGVAIDGYAPLFNEEARAWGNTVALIGLAKPGFDAAAVDADLKRIVSQLKQREPALNTWVFANARDLGSVVRESLRRPLLFLLVAAAAVLAIVTLNLGGLLLARGATRERELAVRCALGAPAGRIARQLLTECFALVATGAVAGTFLAWLALRWLATRAAAGIPLLNGAHLEFTGVAFTVLICLIVSLLAGALPAWRLSRHAALRYHTAGSSRGGSFGPRQTRLRTALVVAEIALACALAVSAGLVVGSLYRVLRVDLGFVREGLIAVRIDAPGNDPHYADVLLDRVRGLPGVTAAGLTDCIPIERDRSWGIRPLVGGGPDSSRTAVAHVRLVSPGLLGAMGIPIIMGRDFSAADLPSAPVAIILNQTAARQFWPNESAVGRVIVIGNNSRATVIAVVADVHHSGPEVPAGGEMYLCQAQVPESTSWDLMVRTTLPPSALAAALRSGLRDIDPTLPISKVRTMSDVMAQSLSSRRLLTGLVGGFAAVAVLLAVIGLFGVISYAVAQQRREFGIRLALGAVPRMLASGVVARTLRLAALGVVLGLILAAATSQLLRSLLFDLSPLNLTPYCTAAILLFLCAGVAAYLPAASASRVNPLEILRDD